MDFATLWELLGIGMEADLEKKTWSIEVGPIKISGLKLPAIRALADDKVRIERMLSEMFIQRGVMWEDFRAEKVSYCIDSARSLQDLCTGAADEFSATGRKNDAIIASFCLAWANECDTAASVLISALESENDPMDSGMDTSARDSIPDALGALRKRIYPLIGLLIDLLPDTSPVKSQAAGRLANGKDQLIRHYGVSSADITKASLMAEAA